jgi:hypothetical protein
MRQRVGATLFHFGFIFFFLTLPWATITLDNSHTPLLALILRNFLADWGRGSKTARWQIPFGHRPQSGSKARGFLNLLIQMTSMILVTACIAFTSEILATSWTTCGAINVARNNRVFGKINDENRR